MKTGKKNWKFTSIIALLVIVTTNVVVSVQDFADVSVKELNSENLDRSLADPSVGLWFLKFYAPWCGHCKQLAPTLDKVAPQLAGKMAFGKIDCTVEKRVCEKFGVKSYPTLKIHRDGVTFPYPGERSAESIIAFAEKMSSNSVIEVSSYDDAIELGLKGNGVVFVAYDSEVEGETVEEKLQSSLRLQIFSQIARKQQAMASFALLSTNKEEGEISKFGAGNEAFYVKIEKDVPSEIYTGALKSTDFLEYVQNENFALITELGASNFRAMGDAGKPLAIAVINKSSPKTSAPFLTELRNVAINLTSEIKDKYVFCSMDGIKWGRFLNQFDVKGGDLPTFFILDVPKKKYWDQPDSAEASKLSIEEILKAHAKGDLPAKVQGSGKIASPWYFNPWVIFGMVMVSITIFFLWPISESEKREINATKFSKEDDLKKDK